MELCGVMHTTSNPYPPDYGWCDGATWLVSSPLLPLATSLPGDAARCQLLCSHRITEWENNFQASEAGELNSALVNVLKKVILASCLAGEIGSSRNKTVLFPSRDKLKSYPCVQDGYSHRWHAQKQESGPLLPLSKQSVHYGRCFVVVVVIN